MSSREIITLQIGNYSNFVGAHLFNIQQEYLDPNSDFDPIVTWRQNLSTTGGVRGLSWSPRVLIFDLKQNWSGHSVSSSSNTPISSLEREQLLQETERNALWHGSIERVGEVEDDLGRQVAEKRRKENSSHPPSREVSSAISTKLEKIEIGQGESNHALWSDYIRWRVPSPEKITFSLPNFAHNLSTGVISSYGQGLDIYSKMCDSVEDGLRFYAEDCDCIQGFQVLVDQNDGFSGFSKGVLEHISDEYEKKCCIGFGVSPADSNLYKEEQAASFRKRLLNTAWCWNTFNQHGSVFTSLGLCDDLCKPNPTPSPFQWLNYKGDSLYETSAVLAATLDFFTTSFRLKQPSFGFAELIGLLSGYGHKMTVLGSAFPLSLLGQNATGDGLVSQSLFQTLNENGLDKMLQSMTPGISLQSVLEPKKSIGNFFLARGIPDSQAISEAESKLLQRQLSSRDTITTAQSFLELYSQETYPKSLNIVCTNPTPYKLSYPFPTSLIDRTFLQHVRKFRYQTQDYWTLPVMASAHNTMEVGVLLEKLLEEVSPAKMRRSNFNFEENNIDADDFSECLNDLKILRDSYDNN